MTYRLDVVPRRQTRCLVFVPFQELLRAASRRAVRSGNSLRRLHHWVTPELRDENVLVEAGPRRSAPREVRTVSVRPVLACALGALVLGCSEAPRRPPPAVALPSCASPDPGAEPALSIDVAGRVHWRDGLWKDAHEMGEAEWQRDVEALLRRTHGRPTLALDARQSIEALTRVLLAAHHAAADIRLLTQHDGERHAIPISTTVPPRSTSALEVRWSSGDVTLEHGPLRLPQWVATARVPDDGVSAILDEPRCAKRRCC